MNNDTQTYCPASKQAWRQWLTDHHALQQAVWLIMYKKETGVPTISWSEAVEEALCFGWIDGKRKPLDEGKFIQFFSRRKPKGTWSKVNKEKAEQLIAGGLMTQAGFDAIERARKNGSWTVLDDVEAGTIPEDLTTAFSTHPGSEVYFLGLSRSVRKSILQWLVLAKRPETRQKRIAEIAALAAQQLKPPQFR